MDTDTQNHNPADAETGLPFSEAAIHVTYTRDRHYGGLFLCVKISTYGSS